MNIEVFHYPPFSWGFSVETKGYSPPLISQCHGNNLFSHHTPFNKQQTIDPLAQADGILTQLCDEPIYVFSADCIPLLFFSHDLSEPIAAIHAGWRGVKLGIIEKTVSLYKDFSKLHVIIGPSIGSCCFTVKEDFLKEWQEAGIETDSYLIRDDLNLHFGLLNYVLKQALKDIPRNNIYQGSHRCTFCSHPQLPSFRRNKTTNPTIRSWIVKSSAYSIS